MHAHSMTYANEVTKNYTGSVPPFLQADPNPLAEIFPTQQLLRIKDQHEHRVDRALNPHPKKLGS